MENCAFVRGGSADDATRLMHLLVTNPRGSVSAGLVVRGCLFQSGDLQIMAGFEISKATVCVEKNLFRDTRKDPGRDALPRLVLAAPHRKLVIRHNVFDVKSGGFELGGLAELEALEIYNNTQLADVDANRLSESVPRANVAIRNNLLSFPFRLVKGADKSVTADEIRNLWQVGNNVYLLGKPKGNVSEPRVSNPVSDTSSEPEFLSVNPLHPDYLRLGSNGKFAHAGAGGLWPGYIGALPPGPASKEGDWYTRLRERSGELKPTIGPVEPPPPGNQPLKLLPLIDLSKDVLSGEWSKDGVGFRTEKLSTNSFLRLPVEPGEEYSFRAAFSTNRGNIHVFLPFESKGVEVVLTGGRAVLMLKRSPDPANPQKVLDEGIMYDGKRHELLIDVTRPTDAEVRIQVAVDGKPMIDWKGPREQLKDAFSRISEPTLVFGSFLTTQAPAKLLEAQLTTTRGQMKLLRASAPATDRDRDVVNWVAKVGGTVGVTTPSGYFDTAKGQQIPDGPVKVVGFGVADKQVKDDDLRRVAGLERLGTVIVSGTAVTDRGFAHLAQAPNLQLLYANDLDVTDEGIKSLQGLPLRVLHLAGAKISDASMPRFAEFDQLRTLWLNKCAVSDKGLEALARSRSLESLVVAGTNVSDDGVESLQKLPLRVLHIGVSKISNGSMPRFAEFELLEELWLNSTAVSDTGLVALAKSRLLRYLVLTRTKVTEAGVKKLAAALPRCKIEWDGGVIEPKNAGQLRPGDLPRDLLPLVDLAKDTLAGVWKQELDGSLRTAVPPRGSYHLKVPVSVKGDYRVTFEFTHLDDSPELVAMIFPVGKAQAEAGIGSNNNNRSGFGSIDGVPFFDNVTNRRKMAFVKGKRNTVLIEVRADAENAKVTAIWNGDKFVDWSGPVAKLSMPAERALSDGTAVGLWLADRCTNTHFHQVTLEMLNGEATLLRPADAAKVKPSVKSP